MSNGKRKGNSFERVVSKELSKWFSNGMRTDLFWRTSNSGGRHTVRKKSGLDTHNHDGDISSTHPDTELFSSKIYVECKAYKSIGIWAVFTGSGNIITWWRTAYISAHPKKWVFLIMKENNRPVLLFTDLDISDDICKKIGVIFIDNVSVYVYNFKDFISSNSDIFIKKFL